MRCTLQVMFHGHVGIQYDDANVRARARFPRLPSIAFTVSWLDIKTPSAIEPLVLKIFMACCWFIRVTFSLKLATVSAELPSRAVKRICRTGALSCDFRIQPLRHPPLELIETSFLHISCYNTEKKMNPRGMPPFSHNICQFEKERKKEVAMSIGIHAMKETFFHLLNPTKAALSIF
ncbi:hypothetical protein LX32DRAFT_395105 [Colletotrichum zoysiae]|uniref:Uncharacterized protein n=1 Tax=Colletotrichum zoysiae TaxID=1216348 RepID=A0AAD9HUZ1_9PEZI|nr:hypothetical protein LX32DRAFT_395105 [Colletotrichum zoysiae]